MGGVSSAWAQTEVTATWAFDLGTAGQTATFNDNSWFNGSYVTLGSNYTYSGTKTLKDDNGTFVETAVKSASKNTTPTEGVDNVDFVLTLKKGVKFTPKSVSFRATRHGTGGGYFNALWVNGDDSKTTLATGEHPNRDNDPERKYNDYSYTITNAVESEGTCAFRIMIYNLDPNKEEAYCNIVIKGTVSGTPVEETMYSVTTSVTPEGAGSITQTPSGALLAEESAVTFSAAANTGYKFLNKWTVNEVEFEGKTYSIESLSADVNVVAQFKKLPVITFAKPEDVVCINRAFPANVDTVDAGETYKLPNNYMYYKEGYTMTGWNDGTNNYACGASYTVNGDVTLTPVFKQNTKSLKGHQNAVTIKYDFDQNTNGERVVNIENNEDVFITTADVDGETIDVALAINCKDNAGITGKRGKVNNNSGSKARAQINSGAVFTIPVEAGSAITLQSDGIAFSSTTFNGETGVYDATAYTYTYTATEAGDVTVIASEDNMYYKSITVTYPAAQKSYTLTTADTEFYSLYLDYAVTIPENVTAYTGSLDADESVLTVSEIEGDVIPAETAVLVKSSVAGTYTFEETDETATVGATALKGVLAETDATALAETGKVVLTLGMKDNKIGFRKPAEGKIGANKVYLLVSEHNAAKGVSISFGGDTTGISEIGVQPAANAPLYNLAGQRVGEGTKGLLIKNGRKYINK